MIAAPGKGNIFAPYEMRKAVYPVIIAVFAGGALRGMFDRSRTLEINGCKAAVPNKRDVLSSVRVEEERQLLSWSSNVCGEFIVGSTIIGLNVMFECSV